MADPQASWFEVARSREQRKAREFGLVLHSVGIHSGMMQAEGQWIVLARLEDVERARAEIGRYERENVDWPPRERLLTPISNGYWAALGYATLIALLHVWRVNGEFGVDWVGAGRSDAARVASGEWWRAITALTLHADVPHVLGNILFGSVFGIILAQTIGVGLAWCCVFLAGFLGNLVNAWIQNPAHASIGASTAVFGALGAQVGYLWKKRRVLPVSPLRQWAPVIGGIALFGWLGVGGSSLDGASVYENVKTIDAVLSNVDVLAHVTGFACGAVLGLLLGRREKRPWMALRWQVALTLAPVVVIVVAWAIALTR